MIRPIKREDLATIAEINAIELGYSVPGEVVEKQFNTAISDSNHIVLVYVDDMNQEVLGYVHAEKYNTLYSDELLNVLGLAVTTKAHHRGIGKQLMQALEDKARARGIWSIRLNSGEERHEAHRFYEHIGYVSPKKQKKYFKDLRNKL